MTTIGKLITDWLVLHGPVDVDIGPSRLNAYTHTEFKGRQPVGTSAVVIAPNIDVACELLEDKLKSIGLKQKIDKTLFSKLLINTPEAIILNDGEY